jgi:hypothetical protein
MEHAETTIPLTPSLRKSVVQPSYIEEEAKRKC